MDIGKFKASRSRLIWWVVTPPVLIVVMAMSSYSWKQHAVWKMSLAEGLAEVVPVLVGAQFSSEKLMEELGLNHADSIKSEDQLISFLQDAALQQGFVINSVKVDRLPSQANGIPTLSASVSGFGEFMSIQSFLKEIQSDQNMLSIHALSFDQGRGQVLDNTFQVNITVNLMLIGEVLSTAGGAL